MKRREVITLLGGAAAWPLAAGAQQRERVRRVGVLMPFTGDDQEGQARLLAFAQGLQQMGWAVGSNLRIDARWGAGDAERNRKYAAELLALAPDAILANGSPELRPPLQATHDLPIVFANVADPVGQGFVASLPRPAGNVTGFISSEFGQSAKWLELLKEIAPSVTHHAARRRGVSAAGGAGAAGRADAPELGCSTRSPPSIADIDYRCGACRKAIIDPVHGPESERSPVSTIYVSVSAHVGSTSSRSSDAGTITTDRGVLTWISSSLIKSSG